MSIELQPTNRPNTKWTEEIKVGAVYAIKEHGDPINSLSLQINHPNLYQAINAYPGGWRKIVELAGFDPEAERAPRNTSRGKTE